MSLTTRVMNCSPQAVFDVLADGWTYATWVVGAARIRAVDTGFPAPGTRIHHSVGAWPLMLSDETVVEQVTAPHEIQLKVNAWPTGAGRVRISCEAQDGQTLVTMTEEAVSGPAQMIPKPVEDLMLNLRNQETLLRLSYLAESGARSSHGTPGQ